MNRKKLLFLLSICFSIFSFTTDEAKKVTWEDLSYVSYARMFSPQHGAFYDKPIFSRDISVLNQKKIRITGYVIPIDATGERYFLSATPNSSCFFCGKGEKHQMMELKVKNLPANFKMDEYLTFEGNFYTHTDMFLYFPYSLENAVPVK